MIIYKITNRINGKIYIGQTIRTLEKRWKQHCFPSSTNRCVALANAINKYGESNFIIEELFRCDLLEELNELEQICIKYYNSLAPNGYNLRTGGSKNSLPSEITRKKQSIAKLGKIYGPRKEDSGDNISKGKKSKSFEVRKKDTNEFVGIWSNKFKCGRELNINPSHINSCCIGRRKQHKGYIFKFVEVK